MKAYEHLESTTKSKFPKSRYWSKRHARALEDAAYIPVPICKPQEDVRVQIVESNGGERGCTPIKETPMSWNDRVRVPNILSSDDTVETEHAAASSTVSLHRGSLHDFSVHQ